MALQVGRSGLVAEIDSDVANIKLCLSGPGRVGTDATLTNGKITAATAINYPNNDSRSFFQD